MTPEIMHAFVETCDAVAATTKKLEKIRLVSQLLKSLPLEDGVRAAIFLTGVAFPRNDERILGVGGTHLYRLVAELAGKDPRHLSEVYRQHGDLGSVAGELFQAAHSGGDVPLSEVANAFAKLPLLHSQVQKFALLKSLFDGASAGDIKYIIKIITGDLRIGLKESLLEEAIAKCFDRAIVDVRRANMLTGDIGETLRLAASDALASAAVALFRPLHFMLAASIEAPDELFEESPTVFLVEEKYDGIRAQAHKNRGQVRFFSRTLDEVSEFPELTEPVGGLPGAFILDGEILAWQGTHPLPFTELQKRLGRKQTQMNLWTQSDVPVKFVCFDLLYQDGEALLDIPLRERRARLEKLLAASHDSRVHVAPSTLCHSPDSMMDLFRASLAAGNEGIVAKAPDSPYAPGRRGGYWFKLKKPLATLDVVVTAVEYGHGKRHRLLSDYTFAVRHVDQLLNIGKAYSGLTDREIAQLTAYFLRHSSQEEGFRRIVEPTVVIEVAFNNIQKSNRHNSGYALRFPRIVRLRPDKPVTEIDTLDRVAELYAKQFARGQLGPKS